MAEYALTLPLTEQQWSVDLVPPTAFDVRQVRVAYYHDNPTTNPNAGHAWASRTVGGIKVGDTAVQFTYANDGSPKPPLNLAGTVRPVAGEPLRVSGTAPSGGFSFVKIELTG